MVHVQECKESVYLLSSSMSGLCNILSLAFGEVVLEPQTGVDILNGYECLLVQLTWDLKMYRNDHNVQLWCLDAAMSSQASL